MLLNGAFVFLDDDYRRLRLRLSVLVIACLLAAALAIPGVPS